ncbi:FecR domain-containing protein [Peredibacter starrii]|uniref:FecR domain-containing protein n=1 Tax=Peredibacter starrii TaxID=28202 RepID=A0AAX4HS74_9BACT|nr:FecR domain-containing protein [Peredibacter starrii]WPU66184.1 FecR domain-containing protein [Peredibacter starrii]
MMSRRIDQILVALGAMLILISSYQLFFQKSESEEGLALGRLTSTMSVVKTKRALSLDWRDANSGNELTENQLIYTDNNSSAEVEFTQGSSLAIGENSLVKLKTAGKEQSMDLEKGFIRAKIDEDQPIIVQMNGENYLVSGKDADIQINLQDEKGEIGVLKGEVKVEGAGMNTNLNTETALSIDGERVSKKAIYFRTTAPGQGEVQYSVLNPTSVRFNWEPQEEAKVLVSKSQTLKNAQEFSGLSGIQGELSPGLYYFRVESEKGLSLITPFRIIQETQPKLLRPLNGEEVSVLDNSVLLQWKNDERLNFELQWKMGEEVKSQKVSSGSALIRASHSGALEWRVKIDSDKRPEALWSDWQKVQVNLIPLPAVPTDLAPHEVEFQTYDKPNEKIDLSWKSSLPVELEILDPSGKTFTKNIAENNFEWVANSGGIYKWRLRSMDNHLRASDWSEWKTFVLEDLSQVKNTEGIQRIQLKKPDQSVTFSWKTAEGSTSVFELAKDAQFKQIVKRIEANQDTAKISIPEVGAYYWRSREILADGTLNVSEPKRVIIEPVPAPTKPEKLPDLEVPLEELPTTSSFSFWDLIIPSAHADELKGMAKIELPTKEEAKSFIIRIYKDESLSELVYEAKSTDKTFIWKAATPGTYYWQYAIVDFWERQSLFSDPAVLTITGELVADPVQPKLVSPIRAQEVKPEDLILRWRDSEENDHYRVEVSRDNKFEKLLVKKETKKSEINLSDYNLSPQLFYWRVTAFNKKKKEIMSNTGRFIVREEENIPEMKASPVTTPVEWTKKWKTRLSLAWNPSMDSYKFSQNGEDGKIDGNALMGVTLSGSKFFERGVLSGEVLRQTGKVFEGESYLFQRLLFDYVYTWNLSRNHRFGIGLALGQSSGQAYEIQDDGVKAKSVSGLSYGVSIRDFVSFSEKWEMQSKLFYLTGEITQLEVGADFLRHMKNYYVLGGVGYASRSYSISSGEQTSLKVSLGLGKEF